MARAYTLDIGGRWSRVPDINTALAAQGSPFEPGIESVVIRVSSDAIMLDAAVVLLCLANQVAATGRQVRFEFPGGSAGAMGYLDRMGFFDSLNPRIDTAPAAPRLSAARRYAGKRADIVEFQRIRKGAPIKIVMQQLLTALKQVCASRGDCEDLTEMALILFAEMIGNVCEHSQTPLDGYAAFQVYPKGNRACAVVSDSGCGILETLRPTLPAELRTVSDAAIIVEVFNTGLSSKGEGRGCGLPRCAKAALRYKFDLNLRLPTCNVQLRPAPDAGGVNLALCTDSIPHIAGTHISFDFVLDNR